MLRNLTLIALLLNTCLLDAQEILILPESSGLYDLPGDHFLTSEIRNGKVYLTERGDDGAIVWKDSLAFAVPVDTVSNFVLSRFGNTDQYAAILQKVPFNSSDVNIYQFSKLDLSTHTWSGYLVDTIPGYHPVMPLQQADTSTYLFFPWGELGFETRRLNSDMNLQGMAPKDSIDNFTTPQDSRFRLVDDLIWKNTGSDLYIRSTAYSADGISKMQEYNGIVHSMYPSGAVHYRNFVNDDSLLIISSSIGEWRFMYYEKNLAVIDSVKYYVPTISNYTARYRIQNAVVHEGKIYIFAYNTVYSNWSRIFVYDFNFDLVCEIPVSMLYDERQMLEVVNGKVYFKDKPDDSMVSLYEVEACMFTSGVGEVDILDGISVYPNPVQGTLNVRLPDYFGDYVEVLLLDQLGNVVLTQKVFGQDGVVDLSGLARGVYFLKVGERSIKVVKE